jgi:ATP-binding cassette subfamily C protein CydD
MTPGADGATKGASVPAAPGSAASASAPAAGLPTRSVERRLLGHEPRARQMLWLAVGSGFLAAALSVLAAIVMAIVVADVFIDRSALDAVIPGLTALAVIAVARGSLVWAEEVLAQRGAGRTSTRLRRDLTERLFELGPAAVGRERTGELAGVAAQGLEAIETYLASYQPARLLAGAVPALVLVVVLALDPPTVLVLLFTGPILVLLLGYIGGRARAITERRFDELRWMSALFLDLLQGMATLKMFGRSAEQAETIRIVSRRFGDTTMEVLRTAFQTALVLEWGAAVAMAVVAVEVSLRLMDGTIAFERALAVLIVTPEFFLPLRTLAIRYHSGSAGRTAAERVFEVLDAPGPPHGGARVEAIRVAAEPPFETGRSAAPRLEFEAVTFSYPEREPTLDRFTMVVPAGGLTVLAGATGAGKSTVVGLLLRFVVADVGSILVDGRSLDAIDPAAWRASVGWVPQRPHLFHGTVAENLRLARPTASDDDLRRAAEAAGAGAFIRALPGGYDAPIGEDGVRLSGGERQRIAIARALLREVPLLVLDEPTSHLDERAERAVVETLREVAGRATVLVVTHRIRLAEVADQLVVVERGRVVQHGRPTDLLGRDGPWRRLAAADRGSPEDIG